MAGNKHDLERPQEEVPQPGYERTDVDVWVIGKFGIALVLVCVASLGILMGVFHYLITREGPPPPKASYFVLGDATKQPPAPQLESSPVLDLQRERAAEDQILNSYAWIDKQQGIVRIPIDKAIDLQLQKGLPTRPAGSFQSPSTVSIPLDSGLGPIMTQPGGPLGGGAK